MLLPWCPAAAFEELPRGAKVKPNSQLAEQLGNDPVHWLRDEYDFRGLVSDPRGPAS
jgi:hypothetical protein